MRISPVSFGSVMVFRIDKQQNNTKVEELMTQAFKNNEVLKDNGYKLYIKEEDPKIRDASVHNASLNCGNELDKRYKNNLPKGSKDVYFTTTNFKVRGKGVEKRCFLTAATNSDEVKILNALDGSDLFYVARFRKKWS